MTGRQLRRAQAAGVALAIVLYPLAGFFANEYLPGLWPIPQLRERPHILFPLGIGAAAGGLAAIMLWVSREIAARLHEAAPAYRAAFARGPESVRWTGLGTAALSVLGFSALWPPLFNALLVPLTVLAVAGFAVAFARGRPWLRNLKDPEARVEWERVVVDDPAE